MRLQKVLQQAGVCSRREAASLIAAGRVRVNGVVVTEAGQAVSPSSDTIEFDGRVLEFEHKVIYAFHKPREVVCSMRKQGQAACIAEFLTQLPQRVVPVGRLDKDVSGLLLLTNDGDFAERLSHPRFEVSRTYIALCSGETGSIAQARAALQAGVSLDDGPARYQSFSQLRDEPLIQRHFGTQGAATLAVKLCVSEGRHHYVKRLLAAVGLPVLKLTRISFGPYNLAELASGEIREESFKELS